MPTDLDMRLRAVLAACAPSQSLSFHHFAGKKAVVFETVFYNYANKLTIANGSFDMCDGVLYPRFPSFFKKIDIRRDDASAMLSRAVDSFISARDAASLAEEHNRKVQL